MTKRAYAVIVAGFFTVSIAFAIRYGYGILLPEMLPDLDLTKTRAGAIFAAYFIAYTIASPILGILTDRFNYRILLTLFSGFLAVGALLMAGVSTLWQACIAFSIAGLGHAACWAPVAALVQRWVPDNRRGAALSTVNLGLGLGIPLWSLLLPVIIQWSHWKTGWIAMGLFGLGVAALNFILVRNPAPVAGDPLPHPPKPSLKQSYGAIFRDRRFWIIGTAYLFVGFNVLVPFAFLPVYATESLGLPYAQATRFVAVIALSGIGGQLTLGFFSDAIGRVQVMILCGLIMGLACLGMAQAQHQWALYASTCCYGLGYGAVWPTYGAAASDFFSKQHTGGIVGLWTLFLGAGSVVSPVVCGWTIDVSGHYQWAFGLGICSGLLSAAILLGLAVGRRGDALQRRQRK